MKDLINKPLIRWAGSKRKLLPKLLELVPEDYNRYIEPFCGSACLFFSLPFEKKAILSDINNELINAFEVIKNDDAIHQKLLEIPVSEDEYYKLREINPETLDNNKKAIRFLYLNRYCFNGIYRTNKSGKFNVPIGKKTGGFPEKETFLLSKSRLSKAELIVSDYKNTLGKAMKGDFVYIDPPYSKLEKFTGEYGVGSFNASDLPDFIKELDKLNEKKVKFLFSYRACQETIDELKEKYTVKRINVRRHISGFKTEWNEVEEILVMNYSA